MKNIVFFRRGMLSFLAISFVLLSQDSPPFGSPKEMQICFNACENLTWAKDHYEQRQEGLEAVTMTYKIVRWGTAGIELLGTPVSAGGTVTLRLTGHIADGGESVSDGNLRRL